MPLESTPTASVALASPCAETGAGGTAFVSFDHASHNGDVGRVQTNERTAPFCGQTALSLMKGSAFH